jgi:outer membrane protein insertion porin family
MENRSGSVFGVLLCRLLPVVLLLGGSLAACTRGPAATGPYPRFAEFEGRPVGEIRFAGDLVLPRDSLEAITVVHPPRCGIEFIPRWLCLPGLERYELDLEELAGDVIRIQLYYRDHGFYGTRVVPSVDPLGDEQVAVRFAIDPGDRVILTELGVEGTEEILPEEQLVGELPLEVGTPFQRSAFLAAADTLRSLLYRRGYAYADVLRNYSIDTIADIAQAQFVAIPGPRVTVDTILILGADRLERSTIRKQMAVREGEILNLGELSESQRNLYQLNIVNFAAVELAPDSLEVDPDSARATVVVRVVEAAKYLADATLLGYGTIDCLRTGGRLVDRNFLGGGRSMELSASASRIGVGAPLDWGLEGGLCTNLEDDPFSEKVTYRLAADFQQPRLLGTRTQFSANLYAERQAELTAFLREAVGGQLSLSRRLSPRLLLSTILQVERGATEASPAIFCVLFTACIEEDRRTLQDSRWSNTLGLSASWDQTRQAIGGVDGYSLRGGLAWSSPVLLSDDKYLSLFGEGTRYWTLRPGWILAGRLQAGEFLIGSLGFEEGFIPPERRFYGGGPNSVRGFAPNALGPQAYVADDIVTDTLEDGTLDADTVGIDRYPLGGTRIALASAELRFPSPYFSEFLRLAAFVDAGQVWAPGLDVAEAPIRVAAPALYVTPGVGVRITTPIGPIRVDVGYNPYDVQAGPLFLAERDPEGGLTGELILLDERFPDEPEPRSIWDRLQFHIAVGQAF